VTGSTNRATPIAHVLVAGWFVLLACGLSYPLIFNLNTHVPGPPGDNFAFVWNFWWFRFARGAGVGVFDCPYLFAPFGTSLVLHTHTALQSYAGATLLSRLSAVTAHNVVLLAGLAANGIATYALAYSFVRRVMPAVLAGVLFASSSYITLHLLGHFNLVHAWVLPVTALAWTGFLARPSFPKAAFVAIAYAAAMYSDYYYLVYAGLFAIVWTIASLWSVSMRLDQPLTRVGNYLLVALMAAVGAFIAVIVLTGGFELSIGRTTISAGHIRNPLTAMWGLFLMWLALRSRIRVRRKPEGGVTALRRILPHLAAILVLAVLLALPLIVGAAALIAGGDYVTPRQRWLSAPGGIELVTLATGNPLHPLYGSMTTRLFERLDIGLIDQTAWIGLVPLSIGLCAVKVGWQTDEVSRRWWPVAAFFLLWSAGPFLHVLGQGTGIVLPQFFIRFLPILGNARIPGRAFVMVILALAILCAIFVTRRRWRPGTIALLTALALVDGMVIPYPLSPVPTGGRIERYLAEDTQQGSVLEMPLGLQDGFGQLGLFDPRSLSRQTEHRRPIVGGYISRVPERIKAAYLGRPAMAALISLSSNPAPNPPPPLPDDLATPLAGDGVRYVVIDRALIALPTRPELERRGLRFVLQEDARELYCTR
jgi:hypothetical protein